MAVPVACKQKPVRQRDSIRPQSDIDWPNIMTKLVGVHECKSASVILFLPNFFI